MSFEGETHDLATIKEDPTDWQSVCPRAKRDTPEKDRIQVPADRGCRECQSLRGNITWDAGKKEAAGGDDAAAKGLEQKDQRQEGKGGREHAIRRTKQRARMTGPYDGTVEEFCEEPAVCASLANFHLLWDAKKKRPSLDY